MSYDDRQANAPLVMCDVCARRYYATSGATICNRCWHWAAAIILGRAR